MISGADVTPIESTDTKGRWYLHNGFNGWSYGSPLNPTPITRTCAIRILTRLVEGRHPDAISKLTAFPNALDYADENDDLYLKSGGNRLIAFVNPDLCVFEKRPQTEQDFQV